TKGKHQPSSSLGTMALKPVASLLLFLNFCMYVIVTAIGGWAINVAVNRGFIIGPELVLPAHFTPVYFPIGNFATGFFVVFALIAGTVGAASAIAGFNHIRFWNYDSLQPAASSAFGLQGDRSGGKKRTPGKKRQASHLSMNALLKGRVCDALQRTMEAFLIILSATQLVYILVIHGGSSKHQARASS
ncbi:hypothetical protein B296_00059038, partial [Ensete ventricosum]